VSFLNVDFLAGCLTGSVVIPWLISAFTNNGWRFAPKHKPPIGEEVLMYIPKTGRLGSCIYRGPEVDGDIPENADLYWRPFPRLPFDGRFDMDR